MLKPQRYLVILGMFVIFASGGVFLSPAFAKETLTIGLLDNVDSLDPAKTYVTTSWGALSYVYETLVTLDKEDFTKASPQIATSWEISEDGKIWTFHLRKDKVFSSGNPINADAVVFSLRRAIKLAYSPSWMLSQFGLNQETISQIDDYTIRLETDKPYAPQLVLSCLALITAAIVDPEVVMEHELDGDMGSAWLENHSAGSGPFVLENRKKDLPTEYTFIQNTRYSGQFSGPKRLIIKGVQDSTEQMLMLQEGTIDIAWDLQPFQAQQLQDEPDITVFQNLTFSISYLGMNMAYEPLADLKVREAIRHAINYEELINGVLQGAAQQIQTFIPNGTLGYTPEMPYRYDINKAKALLTEAGYSDGFELELKCYDFSPWIDIATQIKANLSDIGINVTINPRNSEQLIEETWSSERDYQMVLIYWMADYADPDGNAKGFAHSDSTDDDATFQLAAWWCNYMNVETSALVEQAALEADLEVRSQLYQKMAKTIVKEGPFAFLYSPVRQYGVRSEVIEFIGQATVIAPDFPPIQ